MITFNKKILIYFLIIGLSLTILSINIQFSKATNPPIEGTQWTKTYGGPYDESVNSIIQTKDDGYVLVGSTYSFGTGNQDFYLVKTDVLGNSEWNKTYGGTNYEVATSVVQTEDNGYAIVGRTDSFGAGNYDFWLVKTNSYGNMEWNKTYGGTGIDWATCIIQTNDNGYAIVGFTQSFGAGHGDFYLIKLDAYGNQQWNKTYGGYRFEEAYSMVQTKDNGYVLAGETESFGARVDFWLIKTDTLGNIEWNKTYGGTGNEAAHSIIQTKDDGYVLAGYTASFSTDNYDFYLVKTDAYGNMEWNKTYGGERTEVASCVIQSNDDGYALVGYTTSFGTGGMDFWLIKTDADGDQVWNKTFGGTSNDMASCVIQTKDNAYALAGSYSPHSTGGGDFWLVKTATLTVSNNEGGRLYPVPESYSSLDLADAIWLNAHADTGYKFSHFLINGIVTPAQYAEEDGDYTYYLNTEIGRVVQAVFTTGVPVFPTLTVLNSPGGRMYPHPGNYISSGTWITDIGASTWLVAHPDLGYRFSHFLIDGIITSSQYLEEDGDYTYYLNMDTSHTVQAVFTTGSPIFSTLTVLDSIGGQIYPSPGMYIPSELGGNAAWLIAHPNLGYSFKHFVIDGVITPNQYLEDDGDHTYYLKTDTSHSVQAIFTPDETSSIDQWPTFHHDPAHSGFSTSTAPKTNQTAWICYMGGLGRPFAVADGLVYAPTYGVNLYAIDAATGAIRWSYTGDGGYGPLPTVAGGYVYFGTEYGRVYALNAQTSALKWSFQAGGRLDEVCPTVVDGVVYIGSHSGKLYAIDALSGYQLWSYQTGDDIRTSAAVVDGKVYVGSDDGKIYAFNATSGTVEWTFSTGAYITSSPTIVEGKLYFGSENNNIYALNASTGGLIWKYLTNSKIVYCSPAVAYNTVYIGSYYGTMFYALNAFTGNLIWKFNTGAVSSAPAVADGVVYLGSTNRNVYAFNAYTGEILWKYQTNDIVTSSPAIAYGKVYVGSHDGNVYAF